MSLTSWSSSYRIIADQRRWRVNLYIFDIQPHQFHHAVCLYPAERPGYVALDSSTLGSFKGSQPLDFRRPPISGSPVSPAQSEVTANLSCVGWLAQRKSVRRSGSFPAVVRQVFGALARLHRSQAQDIASPAGGGALGLWVVTSSTSVSGS